MSENLNPVGAQPTTAPGTGLVPLQRGPTTDAEREAQVKSQEALAKRLTIGPDNRAAQTARLATNSVLTTDAHVGKGAEPDKSNEAEALKASQPNAGVQIKTVPISTHESGAVTDEVVVHPVSTGGGAAPVQTHKLDAIGTAKIRQEARAMEDEDKKPTNPNSVSSSTPTIAGPVQTRETTPGNTKPDANAPGPGEEGYVAPQNQ